MKKLLLTFLAGMLCVYVKGQETSYTAVNPNNSSANVSLNWLDDIARIRVGGMGVGASNGFSIQGVSNKVFMRFLQNGNVGVGTADPQQLFTISETSTPIFRLERSGTNNYDWEIYSQSGGGLFFRGGADGIGSSLTDFFAIQANGKVGIGIDSPTEMLHVSSGTSGDSVLKIEADTDNNNEGDNARIEIMQDGGLLGAFIGFDKDWGGTPSEPDNYFRIGTRRNGTDSYNRFVLNTSTGNVGIGTTNITEKLTVDGRILAEEVKVQNVPNSDYVFEPNYQLRPINEVETFIKENKHLPDIPSAEEFKENGVGLGDMDNMLLRKVEELTLYVIELRKENEELKNDLKELKNNPENEK